MGKAREMPAALSNYQTNCLSYFPQLPHNIHSILNIHSNHSFAVVIVRRNDLEFFVNTIYFGSPHMFLGLAHDTSQFLYNTPV